MPKEKRTTLRLEIAHVLFIDIVSYSRLSIDEQHAAIERLNQAVQSTGESRKAEAARRLLKIPTGDGMALVFYDSPEALVECALEISRALSGANLPLRMGINSGPVSRMRASNFHSIPCVESAGPPRFIVIAPLRLSIVCRSQSNSFSIG